MNIIDEFVDLLNKPVSLVIIAIVFIVGVFWLKSKGGKEEK